MNDSRTSAERVKTAHAAKAQVQARSVPSCSFCLFVQNDPLTNLIYGKDDSQIACSC
jgi:hypothetical protein